MTAPEFPTPFVRERTAQLGYGTGPWRRERLVDMWGTPAADKYIGDAKSAGWLVSPYRGTYFVPQAQDLMVVSWLANEVRQEFLISRTLASGGIRAWCLSAWCRDGGLDLGVPVFVTDLRHAPPDDEDSLAVDLKDAWAEANTALGPKDRLPFLDSLVIVPRMPPVGKMSRPRIALIPEAANARSRRQNERMWGQAIVGVIQLIAMTIKRESSDDDLVAEFEELEQQARGIPYTVGPDMPELDWIVALLASLGISRAEELISDFAPTLLPEESARIQRWAGLIGPPQPNERWRQVLQDGPFPYLLVPPALWNQMGAEQASRRFRMLATTGGA